MCMHIKNCSESFLNLSLRSVTENLGFKKGKRDFPSQTVSIKNLFEISDDSSIKTGLF